MSKDAAHRPPPEAPEPGSEVANRVLILFAHPALEKSRVNRRLVEGVRDLPGVTLHDLYEAYPDFHIRIDREQALLAGHDVIVLQHPLFWYSTPALLKEWQDLVLEHGWAFGSTGNALRGKVMVSAITAGGREEAYHAEGFNRFTIRHLLAPIEQTATLCGMEYLGPFVVHGTHGMVPADMGRYVDEYQRLLKALRDGRIDREAARRAPRLNADLASLLVAREPSTPSTSTTTPTDGESRHAR